MGGARSKFGGTGGAQRNSWGARSNWGEQLGGARSKQHPMAGNDLCTMHKDELMHNNFAPHGGYAIINIKRQGTMFMHRA
ncbi:hypothetical protein QL285_026003 [Trifolium repens]|nr:hypothetical protein QL285_026003 [Trifolium repens]